MLTEKEMTIAVVDDIEQDSAQISTMVHSILQKLRVSCQISEYKDGIHFLKDIRNGKEYDLLLLDVLMNEISGLELARKLRDRGINIPVVFISSNREMAMYGYEVSAVRYLAKPLEEERMKEALIYCLKLMKEKKEILLPTVQGQYRTSLSDIQYVEAFNRGTKFQLNHEMVESRLKFAEVENILPKPVFLMCHRSFIVNLAKVQSIRNFEFSMKNGSVVPIGKMRYPEVYRSFVEYISD